ncbi:MAG: hypothetical protein K0Q66_1136 [Chitinophagaceae bacterium]|jgi:hypothetical protein|nr:hypothetical protein [Chitinophagaceae bacterium]
MQKEMAEKYRLQYLLLVREFLGEVEKGTEWNAIKPILQEMKRISHCLECIEDVPPARPNVNYAAFSMRA